MAEPSVLMLSHPFVPAACAGTFRSLRFAEYLPQFGWKPLVVTRSPAAVTGRIDSSLGRLLPSDTVIAETTVLSPYSAMCRKAKALFGRNGQQKETSCAGGPTTPVLDQENRSENGLLRTIRSLNRPIERWVGTPDQHVGWVLPAVKAGLSLVRQYRPLVIYSTGPPHSTPPCRHLAETSYRTSRRFGLSRPVGAQRVERDGQSLVARQATRLVGTVLRPPGRSCGA